ncbi:MAG: hypothetical protein RR091_12445 [Cloacibacillus sp.]
MKQITINVSDNDYTALESITASYNSKRVENGTIHIPCAKLEELAELALHRGLTLS